ncbi:hypothetical protein L596_022879 [Steinernema carpocapsae]|uniref:Uncharacterized protein n=1 Tax=Steinernema carpocapsae TaxID=34508 RepID=A0A4U5MBT3_STECR|nr:hypothetical protein L596_022879 [Steinernema carpocapsae]
MAPFSAENCRDAVCDFFVDRHVALKPEWFDAVVRFVDAKAANGSRVERGRNPFVKKFKKLTLTTIAAAVKFMKFVVGSKRFEIIVSDCERNEKGTASDRRRVVDGAASGGRIRGDFECFVTHALLCDLIGLTPQEATGDPRLKENLLNYFNEFRNRARSNVGASRQPSPDTPSRHVAPSLDRCRDVMHRGGDRQSRGGAS